MYVSNPKSKYKYEVNEETETVRSIYVDDFQYTSLGMFIIRRLIKNRDVKILITSKGNTTGTGKSTLAILLSRIIDRYASDLFNKKRGWKAENNAFTNGFEFVNKYKDADEGDVLITDELEIMLDNRRSMSQRNVEITQRLQTMRYKNVVTIATLPGLWSVDKRARENFDVWINVGSQGFARPYYLTMDDFTGENKIKRFKFNGRKESLIWLPIDDDPDKKHMDKLKSEVHNQENPDNESNVNNVKKMKKDFAIETYILNEVTDMGLDQGDIGDMIPSENPDKDGMSQQWVSKVIKESKKDGTYEKLRASIKNRLS